MASKSTNLSAQDLIAEARQLLESTKKKICRRCKKVKTLVQSGHCEECQREVMAEAAAKRQNTRIVHNSGHIVVYDENDKLVAEHRWLMEKHLGRKLTDKEVVFHRDGNRQNNDLSNLVLGIKHGIPLDSLRCTCCNSVGTIEVVSD